MEINVDWTNFKNFVSERGLSIQYLDINGIYYLFAFDGIFSLTCKLEKSSPNPNVEQSDFETNFKANGNKKVGIPRDSDGSPLQRTKMTTSGWGYQLHGIEFKTSQLNSIYSKNANGDDLGFSTIKCYDSNGNELTTQIDCALSAVKTVIDWEPTHDYEALGGFFKLTTIPVVDIRLWVIGVPDVPANYGGSKEFVSNINLKFIGLEEGIKADGRTPKYMTYDVNLHTNKLRLILTHPAGYMHDLHAVFEIFKP